VRRHIAHARSVLNTPVTIVKIPIMRFIFVSVERFDEAVVKGLARLLLVISVSTVTWLTHDYLKCTREEVGDFGLFKCQNKTLIEEMFLVYRQRPWTKIAYRRGKDYEFAVVSALPEIILPSLISLGRPWDLHKPPYDQGRLWTAVIIHWSSRS
jgi:hypothetical protein